MVRSKNWDNRISWSLFDVV